jgi:membrane associated rhomboid family serine protease
MGFSVRDRGYGPPPMNRMTVGVKWLLIINTALFLVYFFAARSTLGELFGPFGLVPRQVLTRFAFWQLFTYLFLHSPYGFSHILLNMLTLWMFGSPLESVWGTRRFLQYYFFCGIGAGVCVVVLNLLFGSLNTRTIGASGAIYGLLLAFGILFPKAIIYFFGLFPIEARWYVIIMGLVVFLSALGDSGGTVSHFAHLGGMAFGFAFLRLRMGSGRKSTFDLRYEIESRYKEWKLRRAKKKFQVYLKKQGTRRDDWVN